MYLSGLLINSNGFSLLSKCWAKRCSLFPSAAVSSSQIPYLTVDKFCRICCLLEGIGEMYPYWFMVWSKQFRPPSNCRVTAWGCTSWSPLLRMSFIMLLSKDECPGSKLTGFTGSFSVFSKLCFYDFNTRCFTTSFSIHIFLKYT